VNRVPRSGRATRSSLRTIRPLAALLAACLFGAAASASGQSFLPQASLTPTVKLTARPQAYSHSSTAKFAWAKTNATATACRLDSHKYAACKTHITYAGLAAGKHTFAVRVTHGARVKVATALWTVDLTPPTAPTVSGGTPSWVTTPATVSCNGDSTDTGGTGVESYQYRVLAPGATAWGEPTSGSHVTITTSGISRVEFRALDRAGNASPWSAPAEVMLDDDPPSLPNLSGEQPGWQNTGQETVMASGSADALNDPVSYRYRTSTDGVWPTTWGSNSNVTISAEGTTLVQFEAADALGNWSAPKQTEVQIDRTKPTSPVLAGGTGSTWSNLPSVKVTASGSTDTPGSGLAGYQYTTQLLGGAVSPVQPGSSVTVSAEGKTTVRFWAVDASGLTSNPVTVQVWLDHTLPTTPAVSGGSSTGWENVPSLAFSAAGSSDASSGLKGYQYETSSDGKSWGAAQPGSSASITAEGTTYVRFQALDLAGNPSPWTLAAWPAMIDRSPPTAPVLSNATGAWVNAASVAVKASGSVDAGSGLQGYQYETSLNGGGFSAPQAGSSVTVSSEGVTVVQFQAVDNLGKLSAWTSGTVRIDRTAPDLPTISGGTMARWLNVASVTLSGSGSTDPAAANGSQGSGVAGYQYRTKLNSALNWGSPVSQPTITISAPGWTDVEVRGVDAAGNTSDWTVSGPSLLGANWVLIDRTPPTPPTVTGGSPTCKSGAIPITAAATDTTSSVKSYAYRESSDNGATWTVQGTGQTATITTPGRWIVQFQAVDQAGNTSAWAPATAGAANTACHT